MNATMHPITTGASIDTLRDYHTEHERQRSVRRRAALESLARVGHLLRTCAPVHALVIEYSGSGDDGQHDELYAVDAAHNILDVEVPEWSSDLFNAFIPDGYQDNLGGYGKATYLVSEGRVLIEHSDYVLDSRESSYAFAADGTAEEEAALETAA